MTCRDEKFNKDRMEVFNLATSIIKRPWHVRERNRYALHPTVRKVLEIYQPLNWHTVLLEWSHVSTDGVRLAFTRNEKKGEADLQEVTTVGKYIKRHFPQVPDHTLRDFAALKMGTQVEFCRTTESMIAALMQGPASCMTNGHTSGDDHPYHAYAPEYGWHLAVRLVDGVVMARALCNDTTFVRTYGKTSGGCTQVDDELQAHLQSIGYCKESGWEPGTKLARISTGRGDAGVLAPYLDGGNQNVHDQGNCLTIADGDEGDYQFNGTDGTADCTEDEDTTCCACCDDYVHYEETTSVGIHGDESVCRYCRDEHYSYATGRNQESYYLHDNFVVHTVNGDAYDEDHLDVNGIVLLENDDYVHEDNAFCCPVDDCWYIVDDGVMTQDNGFCHKNNVWTCDASGLTYSDSEDFVMVDGKRVHPDCVEEEEEEDEVDDQTLPLPAIETAAQLVARMKLEHAKLEPVAA